MWLPKIVNKTFPSQFLLLNDPKSQIPCGKALKYRVACNLVELHVGFSRNRQLS